jgi:DnaK suppressor protein
MQDYKEAMLKLKEELATRIQNNINDTTENSSSSVEDIDQVQEREANKLILQIVVRDQAKMKQIDEALRLIDQGKYGECQGCGCQIGMKRLGAIPLAMNCLECQEDIDRG